MLCEHHSKHTHTTTHTPQHTHHSTKTHTHTDTCLADIDNFLGIGRLNQCYYQLQYVVCRTQKPWVGFTEKQRSIYTDVSLIWSQTLFFINSCVWWVEKNWLGNLENTLIWQTTQKYGFIKHILLWNSQRETCNLCKANPITKCLRNGRGDKGKPERTSSVLFACNHFDWFGLIDYLFPCKYFDCFKLTYFYLTKIKTSFYLFIFLLINSFVDVPTCPCLSYISIIGNAPWQYTTMMRLARTNRH